MLNFGDSLSVRLGGREPVRAIETLFQAKDVYRWPDLESHWMAQLTSDKEWHVVRWNELTDHLHLDLTPGWCFECPTGFEAWLRWNIRVERQLVDLVEPRYRRCHEERLLIFRDELWDLVQSNPFILH